MMNATQENRDHDIYFEGGNRRAYWVRFSNMLGIAVIIAAVGLYRNSGAVVIAGAYVQMRKEEASLLPGVAIGVSLVPPLSAVGILLYFGDPANAREAALLYLTNLAAIVLSASAVFYFLGMRPAMRDKGYITGIGLGAIATLVVVAILAAQLSTATLARFREARDEERIVVAIKEWSGKYPIEIRHLDVDKHNGETVVDLGFIVDVPGSLADQVIAPRKMFPADVRRKDLLDALEQILGTDAIVIGRFEVRYASQWDIKTRQDIGLPEAVTEEDKQG